MSFPKAILSGLNDRKPNMVLFLSGSGSNAEQILKMRASMLAAGKEVPFELRALVTDAPEKSRANQLGKQYGVPVIAEDIRKFYNEHGEKRVSIATERGQELRQQWTDCLRKKLAPCAVDFAVFAGFVPLTNLAGDYPCLNVHPGDLTYLKDGKRYLVGLHEVPVERAILEDLSYLRSSVIMVRPYTGSGTDDMDSGLLLGISEEVEIDLCDEKLVDLAAVAAQRPSRRPVGGYHDRLEEVASMNLERLKVDGDWKVLPSVVCDFAMGKYAMSEDGKQLYYRIGSKFHPVKTVLMEGNAREAIFNAEKI